MSGADEVEALLDGVAKDQNNANNANTAEDDFIALSNQNNQTNPDPRNDVGQISNEEGRPLTSHSSNSRPDHRERSRSRDGRHARRGRDGLDRPGSSGRGDFYRGNGRPRSRTRSPGRRGGQDRYRESRDYRDRRDRRGDYRGDSYRGDRGGDRRRRRSATPVRPTEEERDRRTVFVQQLAARLRTRELHAFFEKAGKVREAMIVKDRVSGRSKGLGYVEFADEESVKAALELTGKQLLGIPVIVQSSEAEKNRQQRAEPGANGNTNGGAFHRLYIGNVHFNITEDDLRGVFGVFGELEFISLQKDENGRSKGYGFAQFIDPDAAKQALENCNGMDLAGRNIRVGLGNDKYPGDGSSVRNPASANAPRQDLGKGPYAGSGGHGARASGLDRANARDSERAAGGASALDDNDVAGGGFNNFNRNDLMKKLARIDDTKDAKALSGNSQPKSVKITAPTATRSIVIKNMFDPVEEDQKDSTGKWIQELADEVREELQDSYGQVQHLHVSTQTADGEIYARFHSIDSAEKAVQGLQGRFFAGRQILCDYVVDAIYTHMYLRKTSTADH